MVLVMKIRSCAAHSLWPSAAPPSPPSPKKSLRNTKSPWPARAPPPCASHGSTSRPTPSSQKVDRVQIGREMVMAEKSGPWMRVYANTDIVEERQKDAPDIRPR